MKKYIAHILVILLLMTSMHFWQPLTATAMEDVERFNLWANDLGRQPGDPNYLTLHYRIRELYFSVEPHPEHAVIFLGDSITYGGDWSKLFPDLTVDNRGIGGDTTTGLLNRLDEVIAQKPSKIFLMIGTNDLCYGRSVPDIVANYRQILERFHSKLPDTEVYVQSVLPFNETIFPSNSLRTNVNIGHLNSEIRHLAYEFKHPFINLAPSFTGPDGQLPARLTSDGLHLSNAGYLLWRNQIKGLMAMPSRQSAIDHDSSINEYTVFVCAPEVLVDKRANSHAC